jgi:hypothetical protein
MECNRCDWCGRLFWADDPEQGMCPDCKEGPDQEASRHRHAEETVDYWRKMNGGN